jgi:peptidoglycan/LPS O-acetylase OafA/YrhL
MKRFRSHAFVLALIGVAVVIILLVHSIRLRLEWGTGGFILGLIAGGLVALDVRHHRKRRASASENSTSS